MKNIKIFSLVLLLSLSAEAQSFNWKGIFIAGDDSIENFDSGRADLSSLMTRLTSMDTIHLTSSQNRVSRDTQAATWENIVGVFNSTSVRANEGCFIHMTSHGTKNQGFYLSLSGIMSPSAFSELVSRRCGNAPTIILISACYSGQFITKKLIGPNRIVMTAAVHDRPSFGCSADTRYTYWDSCLLSEIPRSRTWMEVAKRVQSCINTKESFAGFPSSYPQAFFGSNTLEWTVRN